MATSERAADIDLSLPGSGSQVRGDTLVLGAIALGAYGFFSTFDQPLKRSALDCATEEQVV